MSAVVVFVMIVVTMTMAVTVKLYILEVIINFFIYPCMIYCM